jgi:hypothetical protein
MKKIKIVACFGVLSVTALSIFLLAADHIDAPAVSGTTTDIADFYAFEGDNPNNTVFVANIQGILVPGLVTENAEFDEDVVIEFNIDNTGDFIEDLVIQAIRREDSMYFFGPAGPTESGLSSTIETFAAKNTVKISTTDELFTSTNDGMSFFAGPRRDPFFFDFNRFNDVASGAVAPEGFLPPGESEDFFQGLNVLSIVIEIPNSMLGTAPPHIGATVGLEGLPAAYNVWVSSKRKQ